jgi:hypothetical protein
VIERHLPFDQLGIDFAAIERRKEAEYEKLNQVARFALTSECRQQHILHYFGDEVANPCRHCDNCRNLQAISCVHVTPGQGDNLVQAIRMALSGVARVEARLPCGKNLIAQMLCGSSSAKMEKLRLNRLSTFGLLSHLAQAEVVTLLDTLIPAGHLEQSNVDDHRPVVKLTPAGHDLMKGNFQEAVDLPLPAELVRKLQLGAKGLSSTASNLPRPVEPANAADSEASPELLDALKRWRRAQASQENIAAFRVFSNATLEELARRRPQTLDDLLSISGIGENKQQRYGKAVLAILGSTSDANTASPSQSTDDPVLPTEDDPDDLPSEPATEAVASPDSAPEQEAIQPSVAPAPPTSSEPAVPLPDLPAGAKSRPFYWTYRLLAAGFSPRDCSAIRRLDEEVILDHALHAVESGWLFHAKWCLSAELLQTLDRLVGRDPHPMIRTILAQAPPGTRYQEVQLFLQCRERIVGRLTSSQSRGPADEAPAR